MLDILVYYVLPNVAMFGGLNLIAKYIVNSAWYFIENYEEIQQKLKSYLD